MVEKKTEKKVKIAKPADKAAPEKKAKKVAEKKSAEKKTDDASKPKKSKVVKRPFSRYILKVSTFFYISLHVLIASDSFHDSAGSKSMLEHPSSFLKIVLQLKTDNQECGDNSLEFIS